MSPEFGIRIGHRRMTRGKGGSLILPRIRLSPTTHLQLSTALSKL
jgi:hypothetical protein